MSKPRFIRDREIAMVMLGTHGSTTYPPKRWHKWRWCERDYYPEWLEHECLRYAPQQTRTVLDFSLREPKAPRGWKVVCQYAAGERECPWCGPGTGNESERPKCRLCEGDGLLYWGEECQVVVMARGVQ
jgi:hypothetical protein